MTVTAGPDFAAAASRWLADQSAEQLRVAREVIHRRAQIRTLRGGSDWQRIEMAHQSGVISGMCIALSYLGDRPEDISDTGAEGFISAVADSDRMVATAAAGKEGAR